MDPHDPVLALLVGFADLWDRFVLFGLLIVSLSVHEFGHAWTALRLGDDTAKRLGRVTLNPLPHLDPVFSVLLPLALLLSGSPILFGAGKPVPVDVGRLRRPGLDMMLVSVAGPFMNVVLAALLAVVWHLWASAAGADPIDFPAHPGFLLLQVGIMLNLLLAVFNLIPVPPLDGHRVLGLLMPEQVRQRFYRMHFLGLAVLVILIFFDGFDYMRAYVLHPLGDALAPLMPGRADVFPG